VCDLGHQVEAGGVAGGAKLHGGAYRSRQHLRRVGFERRRRFAWVRAGNAPEWWHRRPGKARTGTTWRP
jgi:hypothetical protein